MFPTAIFYYRRDVLFHAVTLLLHQDININHDLFKKVANYDYSLELFRLYPNVYLVKRTNARNHIPRVSGRVQTNIIIAILFRGAFSDSIL